MKKEIDYKKCWAILRIELERCRIERKFNGDVERFTAYDYILKYMNDLEDEEIKEGIEDEKNTNE